MTQFNNLSINKDASRSVITKATGSFNKVDDLLKQTIIEVLANDDIVTISLDGVNLTQKSTFTIEEKIDAATYEIIQSATFPKDFDGNGISLTMDGKGQDQKITIQSQVLEGAVRAIPFSRVDVVREVE